MKRRIVSVILCVTMLCGVLSGCGNSEDKDTEKQPNTESNTQEDTQSSIIDTMVEEAETEIEDPIHTVTISEYEQWVHDFLDLYLGCQVDYYFGKCKVEPVNVTTMTEYSRVVGMVTYANEFKVPLHDYDDSYYMLDTNLVNYIGDCNTGNREEISFGTTIIRQECNMDYSFNYYDDTTQKLASVHKVNFYIDDNLVRDDLYFACQWYYDEFEWLMEFCGFIDGEEYLRIKGSAVEGKVVNEDEQRALDELNASDSAEYLKAYGNYTGGMTKGYMVKTSESDVPYLFTLSDSGITTLHYENGTVVERSTIVATHLTGAALVDGLKLAMCEELYMGAEFEPERSYSLCNFAGGKFGEDEFFDGESIDEATYEEYLKKGVKLDIYNYEEKTIEEAYENMIIWE